MANNCNTIEDYLNQLPNERREAIEKIRKVILDNLPEGFKETISYGMLGYVVPHELYPKGYHCNTKLPLPFLNLASQKNYIALYHMGIYVKNDLLEWFVDEYKKVVPTKIDMGKSCIRFKKMEYIPYDLIGKLIGKMSVNEWIELYESNLIK